jgi:hypothetical protein
LATDWYTKLVLTVLAVCAALLVARDFQGASPTPRSEEGRFRLQVIPMARMMLKIDSETGETWRTNFPKPEAWELIGEESTDGLDEAAPEPGAEEAGAPEAAASQAPPAAAPEAPAAADPMAAGTP